MVGYQTIVSARSDQEFINLARKYYLVSFLAMQLIAGRIWKGDVLIADSGRFGQVGRMRNLSSKNQRERSIDQHKREE